MLLTKERMNAMKAKVEGQIQIARLFRGVADIEAYHEERYKALLDNIKNNQVFKKDDKEKWECRDCGHIYYGEEAPGICPVCSATQSFFQIKAENY